MKLAARRAFHFSMIPHTYIWKFSLRLELSAVLPCGRGPEANLVGGNPVIRMADSRTISQLEAEGYPWIGCECCKGTVWVPFKMLRERIPMLSAMTLDQLGARMKCDKCGKRPERYYPANQNDTPGFVRSFWMPWVSATSGDLF